MLDSTFSVQAAMVDADNPLDDISGTISLDYLQNSTWTYKDKKTFSKKIVRNGIVYRWIVPKWGVKEKFEYDITVADNGLKHHFKNTNKDNYTRYNFVAAPYDSFSANGGQRHHFVPATSLRRNGFNASKAYCIRMMTEDHKRTGSYGSSSYVSEMTALLKDKKYVEALQKEVDDLKAKMDSEGVFGTLQQKYYYEVVTCLYNYEKLFGVQ